MPQARKEEKTKLEDFSIYHGFLEEMNKGSESLIVPFWQWESNIRPKVDTYFDINEECAFKLKVFNTWHTKPSSLMSDENWRRQLKSKKNDLTVVHLLYAKYSGIRFDETGFPTFTILEPSSETDEVIDDDQGDFFDMLDNL